MSLRPRAHIHLANIADNWRTLQAAQTSGLTGAVIKADAYGHGLARVGETLHDAGCDHFFVAHSFEGLAARKAIGPHGTIYVLNGPAPYEDPVYTANALTPVINTMEQFQTLVTWIQSGLKLRDGYVLHFDTGMNRLGLPVSHAEQIAQSAEGHLPALIMSHLISSEDHQASTNQDQSASLSHLKDSFPDIPVSLANSGGVWLSPDYHMNLTRPGIALYGGGHPPEGLSLKPGLTLEAPILQVRPIKTGDTVGYGGTFRADQPLTTATVALGYGDGFPRAAPNHGFAAIGGHRCRILGRISMDLITIDVSAVAELARPGIFAQFIGPDAPLEEQAAQANTIGYELTTGLTSRVERIYG